MGIDKLLHRASIRVHLAPDALIACELQRSWGRSKVTRKACFQYAGGERLEAMKQLERWIGEAPSRRSIVWIVGTADAQYFVLPWCPEWVDPRTREAYARERYEQLHGAEARQVTFSFASASPDGEQLVSFIALPLHAELRDFSNRCRCELEGIKPSVRAVWDQFRDVLESEQGTLCVVEGDRQAIVRHDRKRIEAVAVAKISSNHGAGVPAGGVHRRFANTARLPAGTSSANDLQLPARWGVDPRGDATYAVALCGAL